MKTCIRCQMTKPLDAFGNDSRYADGKHRYCRDCWNTYVNSRRYLHGAKPYPPFLERLWSNIQQCGHGEDCIFCCWPWLKSGDNDGYGRISIAYNGKKITAMVTHIVYEIWHARPIPEGMCACHYCDDPPCCHPLHLWPGTRTDNRYDCVEKGRQSKGLTRGHHTMPEACIHVRGETHYRAKLTEEDVLSIRARYAQGGVTAQSLADDYSISKFAALCVINRKTWKHI